MRVCTGLPGFTLAENATHTPKTHVLAQILNFLKVKFILISIPTIYLSYSYNPVATNTNLRAVTLVYPCSGLNIDSNDITEYRN